MVKNTEGSITYNEWSFAQQQRLFAARIVTSAGPDPVAINRRLRIRSGQQMNISSFYKPTASTRSYELVCSRR